MNSLATLALIYFCFTLISSGILLKSFGKKLDASAQYFLFSELCMLISCATLFLLNTKLIDPGFFSIGIPNFGALCAELAILFSILAIRQPVNKKWFLLGLALVMLLTIVFESLRGQDEHHLVIFLHALILTALFAYNYIICDTKLLPVFSDNPFIHLFRWFELGLVGFGLLRVLASLTGAPVIPRDPPSDWAIAVFSLYVLMGSLRYVSYVGFRITWVDPKNLSENALNKTLVKAIEEKNHLLRGLIASNRVIGLGVLASSLAHQLSQPLTTIALRAETTRRSLSASKQSRLTLDSLDEISVQSAKLAGLVQNLRQLFGSKTNHFKPVKLQQAIDEILDVIRPALESSKIILTLDYQANPVVWGDDTQIQQVLINILNNAIDALSQGSRSDRAIHITLTQQEQMAIISIKDNGSGITPEILPVLFDLYTSSKDNGLGVGLWLSKTIVERHNGKISAANLARGGAEFCIELPLHGP